MKNIYSWMVLIVSFTVLISSCKSSDDSSSADTCSGLFIAVGASGTLLTSPCGTTWTAQTSGTSNYLRSVAYDGSSTLVAVGNSGTILSSSDGTTWTSRTSGTSDNITNVFYKTGGGFVATGGNGLLIISADGTTWTSKTSGCGMTEDMWAINLESNIGVIIGDNGSIYTSSDRGDSCTKRSSGTTVEFNELLYGNSTFVAVGYNGTVLTSSDGITWVSRTSSTTNNLYGGTYTTTNTDGEKEFVLVGESGKIISSENGNSWTTVSPPSITTGDLYGIARSNKTWVVVGASGYIASISDGESDVTTRTSGTTGSLRRVFYKP